MLLHLAAFHHDPMNIYSLSSILNNIYLFIFLNVELGSVQHSTTVYLKLTNSLTSELNNYKHNLQK